jgi:bifunctional DNA-binding transcriptional regulator/antitoxin component of YhaV-PrlF toxin-antitoxin module
MDYTEAVTLWVLRDATMDILTLDHLGRVLIPRKVREQLKLTDESQLYLRVQGDRLILEPVAESPVAESPIAFSKVYRVGTALVIESEPIGDLETAVDEMRADRVSQFVSDYESSV